MLGFIVGTACLIGLVKVLRGGGRWGHGGWGHGGGWGRHGGGWRGYSSRQMLRGLFERLDTTPGQEKVVVNAVDDFRQTLNDLRSQGWDEVRSFRSKVSEAVRGEHLDQESLKESFKRQDAMLEDARKALVASLAKIHEALDDKQRRTLGDLIETGPMFGFASGCGPSACGPRFSRC